MVAKNPYRRKSRKRADSGDGRLRSVIESAVDAIITIDEHGIIETVNPAVQRLFGYSPEELIGQNVKMLMPEPYRSEHNIYLENYLQSGKAKIIGIGREVVARRKDGTIFPIDLAVSEFRHRNRRMFTGIIRDISARKTMEASLKAGEDQMRSIVETAVDGIFTINERGIIRTVNPAALKIFGYTESELIGKNINVLMPEPYHSEHDRNIQNYLQTGKAKIIGIGREVIARRKDGTIFPVNLAVSEFRPGDQRMFTGIVRDISERKKVEERLKTFEENFRQGEKLMVLGMLASEIAHEIGTPLNIISGRVELMGEREKSNEQLGKELSVINQQLERINKIVRQHLNLLRKSEIEQRVELNELLNSLVIFFQPYAEKYNIDLKLSLNSVPVIRGNQDQLQQVFMNLIMNAIEEMREGGKLNIFSEMIFIDGSQFAEVKIRDTGKGIPNDVLHRIFEPFFSTKSHKGGTGLGLAIVNDIVKRHQGEIFVETEQRKGTTFSVRLPAESA